MLINTKRLVSSGQPCSDAPWWLLAPGCWGARPGSVNSIINPLCDIPSGCCFFMGPCTVTCSSLRMLRWVAALCRPLRPVLLLVSFLRSRSPVVGVRGCWLQRMPFVR